MGAIHGHPGPRDEVRSLHVLRRTYAGDARTLRIALGLALAVHGTALLLELPEIRRPAAPAHAPDHPLAVQRYVPPPPPPQEPRTRPRSKLERLLPVPDATPDDPEPLVEPEPELELGRTGPLSDTFDLLPPAPDAPPFRSGSRGGADFEPLLAGIGGVTDPVLIEESYVRPTYPEIARLARREGSVILRAVVERDGAVTCPEVLRCTAPGYGFEDSALQSVLRWRYEPATQDGTPVAVYFTIVVEFTLL